MKQQSKTAELFDWLMARKLKGMPVKKEGDGQ